MRLVLQAGAGVEEVRRVGRVRGSRIELNKKEGRIGERRKNRKFVKERGDKKEEVQR